MKLLVVLVCSGILFGLVTLLFAKTTKLFKEIYQARVQNYKLRAFIGTAIVVLFIIVFSDKKYEGISPNQYRQTYKGDYVGATFYGNT